MSKYTIQNWNAKSQTWNPTCQGVMQFSIYIVESIMQNARRSDSLQCKIEIRDPNSQFAMQNRNQRSKQPVCNAESKSEIPTASLQCRIEISDPNSQFAMQIEISDPNSQFAMQNRSQRSKQPVCNAESKSGMVMRCAGRKTG